MARGIAFLFSLLAAAAAAQAPNARYVPPPPAQPVPFNHKQHLAFGLECKNCHEMPEPGDFAGLPSAAKCMSCHAAVKKDSAAVQRLAAFHKDGKPVPWARVYRIPDYVFFSHKEHVDHRVLCEDCHGPVRELEVMRKVKDTSMAACMDCHRSRNVSIACDFCHEMR
jgi:hypothetical protein